MLRGERMSIDLVAAALWLEMPPIRKFVLVSLCENADQDGFCWPSQKYISARCSISVRSVIPHLRSLEKSGWLKVLRKGRKGMSTERLLAARRILDEGEARRQEFYRSRLGEESSCSGPPLGEVAVALGEVAANKVKLLRNQPSLKNRHKEPSEDISTFLEERYKRVKANP